MSSETLKSVYDVNVHRMRLLAVVLISLAIVATCGCMESIRDNSGIPSIGPMPTAKPLPTVEPLPTAEPITTLPVSPTISPVPPASNDPIIGTWSWQGENNTYSVYEFKDDGTFSRRDEDRNMTLYYGVWERQGSDTYRLIYNTPTPGVSTETITYLPAMSGLTKGPDVYTRI